MCNNAVWLLIRSRLHHFTSSSHCLIGFEMNQPAKTNISLSLSLFCTELASDIQVKEESQSPAPAASSHVPLAVTIVVLVAAVLMVGGFLLKRKLQEPIPYQIMWEASQHLQVEGYFHQPSASLFGFTICVEGNSYLTIPPSRSCLKNVLHQDNSQCYHELNLQRSLTLKSSSPNIPKV